jgi:hypothetical protein
LDHTNGWSPASSSGFARSSSKYRIWI